MSDSMAKLMEEIANRISLPWEEQAVQRRCPFSFTTTEPEEDDDETVKLGMRCIGSECMSWYTLDGFKNRGGCARLVPPDLLAAAFRVKM